MVGEVSDNSGYRLNGSVNGPQRRSEPGDRGLGHCRIRRNRCGYAVGLGLVVVAGLASRSSLAAGLPSLITTYGGDTLWALALFLALGFVLPNARTGIVALLTIALSFGVEVSQLYQAHWINAIRNTRIGGLILGFGFKWSDLLCYTVGGLLGIAAEVLVQAIRKKSVN